MDKNKAGKILLLVLTLSLTFVLAACDSLPQPSGADPEETEVSEAVPVEYAPIVSATGEVVPKQEALLMIRRGRVRTEISIFHYF